jgi:uncharacterized protein YifN (PemK superfamily)
MRCGAIFRHKSLSEATWALCDCVRAVSHDRLSRVKVGTELLNEVLAKEDLDRIAVGLRHAMGIAERAQ